MSRVTLWAITCLVLYVIPWKFVPIIGVETEDLSHEVRLGLSAVSAIICRFCSELFVSTYKATAPDARGVNAKDCQNGDCAIGN